MNDATIGDTLKPRRRSCFANSPSAEPSNSSFPTSLPNQSVLRNLSLHASRWCQNDGRLDCPRIDNATWEFAGRERLSKMPARYAFWRVGRNAISTTLSLTSFQYLRSPEVTLKVDSTFWTASKEFSPKSPPDRLRSGGQV